MSRASFCSVVLLCSSYFSGCEPQDYDLVDFYVSITDGELEAWVSTDLSSGGMRSDDVLEVSIEGELWVHTNATDPFTRDVGEIGGQEVEVKIRRESEVLRSGACDVPGDFEIQFEPSELTMGGTNSYPLEVSDAPLGVRSSAGVGGTCSDWVHLDLPPELGDVETVSVQEAEIVRAESGASSCSGIVQVLFESEGRTSDSSTRMTCYQVRRKDVELVEN